MPISEAKKKANKKWNDENMKDRYDRIQIVVPKGQKGIIQAAAERCGESASAYIVKAIAERMERETMGGGFGFEATISDKNI